MRHEASEDSLSKPFWHLDEELGELELQDRPGGPDIYAVRLKAHQSSSPYRAQRELYPLERDGTKHEVSGKAYILVPDLTVSVNLFPSPDPSSAIGRVTDSRWEGMRHHEIAAIRGLYYDADRAIGLWEVDAWGRLDELAYSRLWQLFESVLLVRFPAATRLYADDAEPGEDETKNQAFLQTLGYRHMRGTHGVFAKEVAA
jgi:hypothetical protein